MAAVLRWGALLAGFSYLWAVWSGITGPGAIVWKAAGVALLALYALVSARGTPGRVIALVMVFGAAGDVLIETHGLIAGALAFAGGHVAAAGLYLANRRPSPVSSQKLAALALLLGIPAIAWGLTGRADIVFYALLLGVMAASAWISRFSRYRVGIGAVMFAASDLLIFARLGPLAGTVWASLAIWALYFGGQYLIATGVVAGERDGLRRA